jgi:hypothetical protein
MTDALTAFLGGSLVVFTWLSVFRTVFTQGQAPSRAAGWTTGLIAATLEPVAARLAPVRRERLLAVCAPLALFALFGVWFAGSTTGFLLIAVASGAIAPVPDGVGWLFAYDGRINLVGVVEAVSMTLLVAVFAVYLIRVVGAYGRRELLVARLAAQASVPSDAERLIAGYARTDSRDQLDMWFAEWADWFADIRCTHVGHPALMRFRSASDLCWLQAAVIVLDAAALVEAAAPGWAPSNTRVLLEAGSSCLQRIAATTGIVLPRSTVSLHGREQRGFADTIRMTRFAGLPVARSQQLAWEVFQRERTRYAPYAAAVAARLRCGQDDGREIPVPLVVAEQSGGGNDDHRP